MLIISWLSNVNDIREVRIQGIQTLGEFIKRRMEPAINTCESISHRFTSLSERVSNASQLLRTRVDIIIERQNQGLLTSMALRAKNAITNATNGRGYFNGSNYLLCS